MSPRESLESARNASVKLTFCLSMHYTPQKTSHGKQHGTTLGSPFQYQPPRTSSPLIFPPGYSHPQSSSTSFDSSPCSPSPRFSFPEENSRILGSPFRYQPLRASPRSSPPGARIVTQAPQQDRHGAIFGRHLPRNTHPRQPSTPRILLASGANISAQGGVYGNPLQAASYRDDEEFV